MAVKRRVLPSVRTVHAGFSLFTPPAELAAAVERFGADVVTGYGSAIEALFAEILAGTIPAGCPSGRVRGGPPVGPDAPRDLRARRGRAQRLSGGGDPDDRLGVRSARRDTTSTWTYAPCGSSPRTAASSPPGSPARSSSRTSCNRGTVLLNYRLGDVATRLGDQCPCGRSLPLLSAVEGRVTDWLRSAAGEAVHPQAFRSVLREVPGLRRYQLVQERPGLVRVVGQAAPGADHAQIRDQVRSGMAWLRDGLQVEVAFVERPSAHGGGQGALRGPMSAPLHRRLAWTAALAWRAPFEARFPFRSRGGGACAAAAASGGGGARL